MKRLRWFLLGLLLVLFGIYLFNASWRVAPASAPNIALIAHRGVHQNFDATGLGNDGCSATRIEPPVHGFLENTIPSIGAAFEAGADIVEFDVHPTTDGAFAVVHDWTLECRTNGSGVTRTHDLAYLKTLDIGHGYTADGGLTFPFRGKGVGLMPELKEVLTAFPSGKFLVNFKSNEVREGDMLAAMLEAHPEWSQRVWGAYGGDAPSFRAATLIPGLQVWSRRGLVDCLLQYEAFGWTGFVPSSCRNTKVMLPVNVAPFVWGWPNLFLQRMKQAGSAVILLGPYEAGDPGNNGIDTLEELALVPPEFDGFIWTNKIEVIGPALRAR